MIDETLLIEKVAKLFGVHARTVSRYVDLWNAGGKQALGIIPQLGQPRKFTPVHQKAVLQLIESWETRDDCLTIKGLHGFL